MKNHFLKKWLLGHIGLMLILLFALLTRLYRLDFPQNYYFDEVYHVPAIKLIMQGDWRAFEWWHSPTEGTNNFDWLHPPVAKYFQAVSLKLVGVNPWGWRLGSALAGVLVVGLTYVLAQQLFANKKISLMAAFLAATDGLLLVQSRIAMNDIFLTLFVLVTLVAYLHRGLKKSQKTFGHLKLLVVGVLVGLTIATKWTGVLLWFFLLFWELWELVRSRFSQQFKIKQLPWIIFSLLIVPMVVYSSTYAPIFFSGRGLSHFVELHRQIVRYQINRDNNHLYQSQPLQWISNTRPVWYWKGLTSSDSLANIYALGNPLIFIFGMTALTMTLISVAKAQSAQPKIKQLVFLLSAYLCLWLPWQFSPRIMFFYHFTSVVPLMTILVAYWFYQLMPAVKNQRLIGGVLGTVLLVFLIFYPHWVGLPAPKEFVEGVYFALSSWR